MKDRLLIKSVLCAHSVDVYRAPTASEYDAAWGEYMAEVGRVNEATEQERAAKNLPEFFHGGVALTREEQGANDGLRALMEKRKTQLSAIAKPPVKILARARVPLDRYEFSALSFEVDQQVLKITTPDGVIQLAIDEHSMSLKGRE